jgi:hypothetical protein
MFLDFLILKKKGEDEDEEEENENTLKELADELKAIEKEIQWCKYLERKKEKEKEKEKKEEY